MTQPMYVWREAILQSDLPPTTRHVLLTLSCHMNKLGDNCFPSVKLLCEETGLSNRTIITHLQIANDLGWITVSIRGLEGQQWKAHQYHPSYPPYLREAVSIMEEAMMSGRQSGKKAVKEIHRLKKGGEPNAKKVVNLMQEGGEPNAKGCELGDKKVVKEVHSSISGSNPESISGSNPHIEEPVCVTPIKPGIAGSICAAIQRQGVVQTNPSHATLLALLEAGATEEEFSEAAKIAVANGKGNFNYVLGIVRKQREDAAKLVLHQGRLPNKQESIQAQNLAVAANWLPPELKEKNHAG